MNTIPITPKVTSKVAPMSRREARDLLPFWVNGSLGADKRAQLDVLLISDPRLALELKWQRRIAAGVRAAAARGDERAGLVSLHRLIDADVRSLRLVPPSSAQPAARHVPNRDTWLQRCRSWLGPMLTPPLALAAAVIVLQGGVIASLLDGGDAQEGHEALRSGALTGGAAPSFVRVMFKPGVTEAQTRALLLQHRLRVVAGPSVLGEYWLWDGQDAPHALVGGLQASSIVLSAQAERRLPEPAQ